MSEQVYEQLTLFPEDSLVSRFPSPGSDEARKMTVSSGRRCSELSRNSGRLGSLVKMCLESSVWHSTRCYLTWQAQATKRSALLYRLAVSMPRTEENESQFWPTLLANGMGSSGHQMMLQKMVDKGLLTKDEKRRMVQGNGGQINPDWAEWLMGYTKAFTQLLPTPCSCEYKTAVTERYVGGVHYRHNLCELTECTPLGKIGLLNPNWTEWLMGYPIGWTELNA